MSRKVVRLTVDHLAQLPTPARNCLFWELDPVRRSRVSSAEAAGEKEAWLSHVLLEWGSCGRVVLAEDRAVGFAVYAPQAYLPGAAAFATAPASPDALLLSSVYVEPAHRGGGLGRLLVQGMARDLVVRGGIRAVEAFGDNTSCRHPSPACESAHRDPCLTPAGFLASVGFKTHRPHAQTPRLRMDLRSAVTWREEVEAAVERLVDVVRPTPAPAPAVQKRSDPPETR